MNVSQCGVLQVSVPFVFRSGSHCEIAKMFFLTDYSGRQKLGGWWGRRGWVWTGWGECVFVCTQHIITWLLPCMDWIIVDTHALCRWWACESVGSTVQRFSLHMMVCECEKFGCTCASDSKFRQQGWQNPWIRDSLISSANKFYVTSVVSPLSLPVGRKRYSARNIQVV